MNIRIYNILVLILMTIFYLNLNGVFYIFTDIESIFSNLILGITVLLIGFLIQIKQTSKPYGLNKLFSLTIFSYIILGLISAAFINDNLELQSREFNETLKNSVISIVFIFIMYNFFNYNKSELNTNKIIKFMTILFAIASFSGVLFKVIGITEYGNYVSITDFRYSGVFANPNELGFYSNISLIFILSYTLKAKLSNTLKFILFLLAVIAIYNVILSLSRTALFSSFIIIFLYLINLIRIKYIKNKGIILLTFLTISSISFYTINGFISDLGEQQRNRLFFIDNVTTEQDLGKLTSNRNILWEHGLEVIQSNPFGKGMGYMQNMPGYGGVHNEILLIMGEAGILVGLFVLIFLIKVIIAALKKKSSNEKFFFLSLIFNIIIYAFTTHAITQKKGILILLIFIFYYLKKTNNVRNIRNY